MAAATDTTAVSDMVAEERGFAATSRTVVAYAAELFATVERAVVGEHNVRTAHGNAYAATLADRDRAQARADMDALVAALAARPRPRNNRRPATVAN